MRPIQPVTLEGGLVRLIPLDESHIPGLARAAIRPDNWRWQLVPMPDSEDKMRDYLAPAFDARDKGTELPFTITRRETGEIIGSTRYLEIVPEHHVLEIGWTWLAPEVQRTGVNTECKFLLLQHAFDEIGVQRVQLKTDARNVVSRKAIERIGAKFEGQLRKHRIAHDGFVRDTVYYSILDSEWPDVKTHLHRLMTR